MVVCGKEYVYKQDGVAASNRLERFIIEACLQNPDLALKTLQIYQSYKIEELR
jgi:hypothetical protein